MGFPEIALRALATVAAASAVLLCLLLVFR
jgi:hypothetical protein